MHDRGPVSLLTVSVLIVVTALAVGSWAVIRSGVQRQDKALLQSDGSQIDLLLEATLDDVQTELRSMAFFTVSSGLSSQVFAEESKPLLASPTGSAAVVRIGKSAPAVLFAAGPDLHQGQALPPALRQAAAQAATGLTAGVAEVDGQRVLYLAAASTAAPGFVGMETGRLAEGIVPPDATGPYSRVYLDLYDGARPVRSRLVATTFGGGALPAPVTYSVTKLGNVSWLLEVSAREAPSGSYAEASPWIALAVGLIIALALALVVETLGRRNRHVARLVEERTAELLDAQKAIIRNERLAAVGEMATVVSHELRNPLGAAVNNLYLLRMDLGQSLSDSAEEHVVGAERQIHRAVSLSEDLTTYMREREPRSSRFELGTVVDEVLESAPPPSGIDVSVEASTDVDADPSLLIQVLANLVTNAYQAMPDGGSVVIRGDREDGATLVSVRDGGTGFDPEVAHRLFDPFFTTKGEGTGLGLAIAQRLTEAHNGTISIENVPTGGAKVTVRLPRSGP
ncbi:MAG: ATP-binding protein [Acidimicrobiales bacterium]|jgi:signal transduction histidine kinase